MKSGCTDFYIFNPGSMIVDGLVNYWPMFNGVYDLRGKGDPIAESMTSKVVNSYGVASGAIHVENGYIEVPPDYYMVSSFSLSYFFRITGVNGWQHCIMFSKDISLFSVSYNQDGKTDFYNYNNQVNFYFTFATFGLNTWYHIAITNQGSTMKIFLNGGLLGTYTIGPPSNSIKYKNYIGLETYADYSEFKIYNKTLTDSEIQQDYNNYNSYLTKINL